MKKTSLAPRLAFTLIELLVVISIIAILAGLTFSGVSGAILSAKKVQARNDMSQIVTAVQAYYTEYGKYPIAAGTVDLTFGSTAWPNDWIISVLRSKTSPNVTSPDTLNPRQLQFLQPKVQTATKGCVNTTSGKWYDPWGTQYLIFIDGDYAGDIDPSTVFSDITIKPSVGVGAASVGYYYAKQGTANPDAFSAARASNRNTDLLSWQ